MGEEACSVGRVEGVVMFILEFFVPYISDQWRCFEIPWKLTPLELVM